MKTKEYQVTFIGHHIISVEAENEREAEQKAIDIFDGCDTKWEIEVDEVKE